MKTFGTHLIKSNSPNNLAQSVLFAKGGSAKDQDTDSEDETSNDSGSEGILNILNSFSLKKILKFSSEK